MTTTQNLSAFLAASPAQSAHFARAIAECDSELRQQVVELLDQLAAGGLSDYETHATTALIAEILYPNADHHGVPGLNLADAGAIARRESPEAGPELDDLDGEEVTFADRLRVAMDERGVTQAERAAKVGIGQPVISMMLTRTCRPQRKTVAKLAAALGVLPEQLWPGAA